MPVLTLDDPLQVFCKRHKHRLQLQLNTHKIVFQVVQFFLSIALDFTGPPEKLFVCIPICKNAEIFKLLFFFVAKICFLSAGK
jgi:hypothetical protein